MNNDTFNGPELAKFLDSLPPGFQIAFRLEAETIHVHLMGPLNPSGAVCEINEAVALEEILLRPHNIVDQVARDARDRVNVYMTSVDEVTP